jgi:hypothetical protein
MDTKEHLIKTIKEWVRLDNDIRKLKKEERLRNDEKKNVSKMLIDIMKSNEIDAFDIKDGQICYTKKNIKKPITKKALLDVLSKYFNGDSMKAAELNEFISENREEVTQETIVRKINKDST